MNNSAYPRGLFHSAAMVEDLSERAWNYRKTVLKMVYDHQTGHIGGAFSVAEILTALYFHHLEIKPENPQWPDRDRLLFSKGHACAMLYTVLAHRGFFPVEKLDTFRELDSTLQGHPEPQKTPGVEVPAGPLGHGIAIGAGMAMAAKMENSKRKVYVIIGDGELNAGVIWEGALVAAQYGLDNLIVILDYNGVQQTDSTTNVLCTEPIEDKFKSFGWYTREIHGHHMLQILDALDFADEIHAKPVVIIARTTKGKGVSFMESNPIWHGAPPNDEQYKDALRELDKGAAQWIR
jgi:transketolase